MLTVMDGFIHANDPVGNPGNTNFSVSIEVAAGVDIETAGGEWECAEKALAFVDGSAANNPSAKWMINFGDADTSTGCWAIETVRYVSGAEPNSPAVFQALPQGYYAQQLCKYTDGKQARGCVTDQSWGGAENGRDEDTGQRFDRGRIDFKGVMTQCWADDEILGDTCLADEDENYSPTFSWQSLFDIQRELYPQDVIDMPYVTNIRYQRHIDGQEASDPSDA
jgi:hypothetical protein